MKRIEFLSALERELSCLSESEREASLAFYCEMLDERIEAGENEADAIRSLGSPKAVAREILLDLSFPKLLKQAYPKNRRLSAWEITLLVLGSPIWLPLLITALSLLLVAYLLLWCAAIVLLSLYAAVFGTAAGCLFASGRELFTGGYGGAFLYFGVTLLLLGLCSTAVLVCRPTIRFCMNATRKLSRALKSLLIRKESAV